MGTPARSFGAQRKGLTIGLVVAGACVALVRVPASAQAARTVQDGVYTDAQSKRGQTLYAKRCATCHGNAMQGAQAPPLAGDGLSPSWRTQPLSALAARIRNTMPLDKPGSLTAQQTSDILARVLKQGGFPAGRTELASSEQALSQIVWPPSPPAPTSAAASAAGTKVYPPLGNMAQLMRGIFFPNSNLLFTVQTHDPAAPTPKRPADAAAGFSWVDWGAGIYGGWELVDNAAIALADASPLMLTPGIRCENGRPAPVTDAAWIKYTEQMIAVSRKMYTLSQTRDKDAVSDATGDLADACANCHQAYRDVRGPGRGFDPTDPSNKAGRCMPR